MRNGDELKVKIIEVNPTEIKYKFTDPASDALHVIYKREAFMVKYGNGTKEVFNASIPEARPQHDRVQLHMENNGHRKIVAGAVMTGIGVPMLLAGIGVTAGSAARQSIDYNSYNSGYGYTTYSDPDPVGIIIGSMMTMGGAALTIIGPITLSRGIHQRRQYKSSLSFAPGAVKLAF